MDSDSACVVATFVCCEFCCTISNRFGRNHWNSKSLSFYFSSRALPEKARQSSGIGNLKSKRASVAIFVLIKFFIPFSEFDI